MNNSSVVGAGMTGPLASLSNPSSASGIPGGLSSYQALVYTIIQVALRFLVESTLSVMACWMILGNNRWNWDGKVSDLQLCERENGPARCRVSLKFAHTENFSKWLSLIVLHWNSCAPRGIFTLRWMKIISNLQIAEHNSELVYFHFRQLCSYVFRVGIYQ